MPEQEQQVQAQQRRQEESPLQFLLKNASNAIFLAMILYSGYNLYFSPANNNNLSHFTPSSWSTDGTDSRSGSSADGVDTTRSVSGSGSASVDASASASDGDSRSFIGSSPGRADDGYKGLYTNMWRKGSQYSIQVYLSKESVLAYSHLNSKAERIWEQKDLVYEWTPDNERLFEMNLTLPVGVREHNESYYLHFFAIPKHMPNKYMAYEVHSLIKYVPRDKKPTGRSLLEKTSATTSDGKVQESSSIPATSDSKSIPFQCVNSDQCAQDSNTDTVTETTNDRVSLQEQQEQAADADEKYRAYWKPHLYLSIVTDWSGFSRGQLPPQVENAYRIVADGSKYVPPAIVNDFWVLKDYLIGPINSSTIQVPLKLEFVPISLAKFVFYAQIGNMWEKQTEMGTMKESDIDEIKRMFLETNPYFLALTMAVSLAHSLLEMLAFKNDISHWKNIRSMEGVSVKSLFWKVGMDFIVFLYLLDNETSWMIIASAGIGVLIEVWKLGKAVKVKDFGQVKLLGIIPWFRFEDKESYSAKTKEYDEQAMNYLSYVLYPCVIGYSIYSLIYQTHKSWYSWLISSLVGAVYTFGFIMMFPQIFINYKLKSVAHLPMKAFMYKALNTIIDDLFSFIIKMPTMHRLACFRDDIVFVVFLYQRWKYPIDKTRVNEFGQSFEDEVSGTRAPHTDAPVALASGRTDTTGVGPDVDANSRQVKEATDSVMNEEYQAQAGNNAGDKTEAKAKVKLDGMKGNTDSSSETSSVVTENQAD